jgi:hypothetical protein
LSKVFARSSENVFERCLKILESANVQQTMGTEFDSVVANALLSWTCLGACCCKIWDGESANSETLAIVSRSWEVRKVAPLKHRLKVIVLSSACHT